MPDKGPVCRLDLCYIKERLTRVVSTINPRKQESEEVGRLLTQTPVVRSACDLDLLVFLRRHPRTLLTSEQLAAFVGRDIKEIAKPLEAFVEAGLLERTQNPMHAARLYLLVLDGPQNKGLRELLELASTREGRQNILRALDRAQQQTDPGAARPKNRLLEIVKIA